MMMLQTYNSRKVLERFALPAAQKIERDRAAWIVEEKPSVVYRLANKKYSPWFLICVGVVLATLKMAIWECIK